MKKTLFALILICFGFAGYAYMNIIPKPATSNEWVFPVWGKNSKIGSFWGDARDAGKRKHEGIDIFAKKGTPVVAVYDGVIVSKSTTPLGGKNLWLQSFRHPYRAYYAHLDDQKVKVGQVVRKGEVIGTVGNTGNAKYTPSHLHFGVYKWFGGPVDPLPYVKHSPKFMLPERDKTTKESAVKKKENTDPGKIRNAQTAR